MVARKANNRSVASTDSALNSVSAQDSASKRKVVKPKIEFNHEALRVALAKARKGLKLSLPPLIRDWSVPVIEVLSV